jgi:hypothetical protein
MDRNTTRIEFTVEYGSDSSILPDSTLVLKVTAHSNFIADLEKVISEALTKHNQEK